eukprot:753350-Hanusia_phi.AAC.3
MLRRRQKDMRRSSLKKIWYIHGGEERGGSWGTGTAGTGNRKLQDDTTGERRGKYNDKVPYPSADREEEKEEEEEEKEKVVDVEETKDGIVGSSPVHRRPLEKIHHRPESCIRSLPCSRRSDA